MRANQRDYRITIGKYRTGDKKDQFEVMVYKNTHRCHAVRKAENECKALERRTDMYAYIAEVEEV